MTTEATDLLELLSQAIDPNAAKERSIQREFGRSALQNFTATVFIDPAEPTIAVIQNPNGNSWTETHLLVHLKDVEVTKHDNYGWADDQDEWTIGMKVPDAGYSAQEDDEAVLWMAGIQKLMPGATLASINGKRIQFEEQHKQYTFKRKKNNYIPEEATRWWYEAVKIVGAANGVKPIATPTEEAVEKAMSLIIDAGDEGVTEVAFNLACSKDPIIKNDKACVGYISDGRFARDMISAGRILRAGANLVVAG